MARSGKHVKVDGLADAILDELKKYSEEATETLHNTAKEVAKDGVKSLKSTSPRGKGSRKGHYADSWYVKLNVQRKVNHQISSQQNETRTYTFVGARTSASTRRESESNRTY